tara:strand:+ start:631 stop:984 length:354 start_codon:yes stop_codon:yes gene_type:complete
MPTPKKTAAPKAAAKKKAPAKKKAAPKKAAPKKAPAKKAAPKPKAPEKAVYRRVYLHSNSGEKTFTFKGDKDFNEAIKIIESAPTSSTGARTPKIYFVDGYGFHHVHSYKVEKLQVD